MPRSDRSVVALGVRAREVERAPLTLFLFAWELESMPEYSTTLPTGTTIGKFWRRALFRHAPREHALRLCEPTGEWCVGCYAWHERDTSPRARPDDVIVHIVWFNVELRHGPAPRCYDPPDWSNFAQWQRDQKEAARV